MFRRKRQLKKEKSKYQFQLFLAALLFLLFFVLVIEYFYLNLSFGSASYINPMAKDNWSILALLESQFDKSSIGYTVIAANSDGSFTVKIPQGGTVIISAKKDIKKQISSLQLILSRLTIEGKKLKVLDFRFDNPVVSF